MTLVHPKLTEHLTRTTGGHFPDTGAVQKKVVTNTRGNPSNAWSNVSGLASIRCTISAARGPSSADERRGVSYTYAESTHEALLDGDYTIAALDHRFLSDGIAYDILGVEKDSQGITTRLHMRRVL